MAIDSWTARSPGLKTQKVIRRGSSFDASQSRAVEWAMRVARSSGKP